MEVQRYFLNIVFSGQCTYMNNTITQSTRGRKNNDSAPFSSLEWIDIDDSVNGASI